MAEPSQAANVRSAHVDGFARENLPPRDQWPDLVLEHPSVTYPAFVNCADELLKAGLAARGPDAPCLVTASETWTYGELRACVDRVAQVLVQDVGLVPGNRVLLRGPNAPWLVACWLAILKAGGVVVATMPLLREGELRSVIEASRPTVAFCDHRITAELLAASEGGFEVIPYGSDDPCDLVQLAAVKDGLFASVMTAAEDVALIAFTSGTTGRPKGCMHFHRDVLAIADTFSAHIVRPRSDDLFITSPPLAFTYGLGGLVVFPLRVGARSFLLERATPDALAEAIAAQSASVCFTAPTAYRVMLHDPDLRLPSLRRCVAAGESLPRATSDEWHARTGLRIIDGIGSTEMLHIFISAADDAIRPGSTGIPVPAYEARVLDDEGGEVEPNVTGRLAVRGPTGCRYLADSRQTQYVERGWNITGDSYLRDDAGYFWFQARTDDMIVSSGYNIAAPEVEEALLRHRDVLEAAVVGRPDPDRGAVVKAFVVLRSGAPGDDVTKTQLQAFVKAEIAPYKYPRDIEFVPELPRTATGKLQRHRLRQA